MLMAIEDIKVRNIIKKNNYQPIRARVKKQMKQICDFKQMDVPYLVNSKDLSRCPGTNKVTFRTLYKKRNKGINTTFYSVQRRYSIFNCPISSIAIVEITANFLFSDMKTFNNRLHCEIWILLKKTLLKT